MAQLPATTAIECELKSGWLTIWFNQPESRNALSQELTADLMRVLESRARRQVGARHHLARTGRRVLRGRRSQGVQGKPGRRRVARCDHREFETRRGHVRQGQHDAAGCGGVDRGRGHGGGFGLACCADVVICEAGAKFAMTETAIGLTPAQISPFVIQKLGYATARRLMLTAARFDAREAAAFGFADQVVEGVDALNAAELAIRKRVLGCAPGAVADLKALLRALPGLDRSGEIQAAAENFADRMLSDEGREGVASFLEKRKPNWVIDP